MKRLIYLLTFTVFIGVFATAQVNHNKSLQFVLKQGTVNKEFFFSKQRREYFDSLVLVYLGDIRTDRGRILKIVTSRWYWGLSPKATSRIVIFNERNQYLGDYYLTMTSDIPDKIERSKLVFINDIKRDCTPGLVTKVSFKKGIPNQFFLRCKGKSGDIYSFVPNLIK